jgi:hypothetical protein
MEYENRVTIFIDVLGFKQILKATLNIDGTDNEKKINELESVLLLIREIMDLDASEKPFSESMQITQFSDSIVISFKEDEEDEVFYTLANLQNLVINLVWRGIICRGGVSYGKLVHNEKMVFGPALVEAYETESKAALYPRIILDKTIIKIGIKNNGFDNGASEVQKAILNLLSKDTDDMYYIDYFLKAQGELDDPALDMPRYIDELRDIIEKGIKNGKKAPDIKVKYGWMKNKFNTMVKVFTKPEFISALTDEELKSYYESLKQIK